MPDTDSGEALDFVADEASVETEDSGALEAGADAGEVADETVEAEPDAEIDYKVQYEQLQKRHGELKKIVGGQGNELAQLRNQIQQGQQQAQEAQKPDPWSTRSTLKGIQSEQRALLTDAFDAYLEEKGVNLGEFGSQFQTLQTQVQDVSRMSHEEALTREVAALQNEVGQEKFEQYRPELVKWYEKNNWPAVSVRDVFRIVSFDSETAGVADRVKQNKAKRQARGAAADAGKTGPKTDSASAKELRAEIMDPKTSNRDAWSKLIQAQGT